MMDITINPALRFSQAPFGLSPSAGLGRTIFEGRVNNPNSVLLPGHARGLLSFSGASRGVLITGFAVMLSLMLPVNAQALPGLNQSSAEPATQAEAPSLSARETELKARRTQIRERRAAVAQDQAVMSAAANADEWAEYKRLLNLLDNAYESHLDALNKLRVIRENRHDLQQKSAAWVNFSEPPPYSIDFVDDQWQQVRLKDRELEAARLEQAMLESLLESQRQAFQSSAQNQRKFSEQLETASSEHIDRARWLQELNTLRNQQDEARLAALDADREIREEQLAHLINERAFLQRKAQTASLGSPMTADDRDKMLAQLAELRLALDAETAQAITTNQADQAQVQQARDELRQARERLSSSKLVSGEGPDHEVVRLQQILDTAIAEAEASASNLKVLRLLAQSLVGRRNIWELHYQVDHTEDFTLLDNAAFQTKQGLDRIALWRKYLRSDLDTNRRRLDAQENRLANWQAEYGDRALETRKLTAYASQEAMLKRGVAEADDLDAHIRNLQESLQGRLQGGSFKERVQAFSAHAIELAGALNDFELLTIEDKITVEGREIVGKRSVTVGKIFQILSIFAIGLWLIVRITTYGRSKVRYLQPGRASAALLGLRLFSLIAVIAIFAFALVRVHIPLTVLTFLGGTLAIGVGFGAQNILNNFISGLILLMERSIKIGDIVEVEGVLSRVTHIGSRCCQVHRFDGIDMLIPNSSFLEKSVTNWTLSDHTLRCSVTVDTAYGAPSRQAMALVERAAAEHHQVMKNPVPEVYLQEFGADALNLRLDFWIDLHVQPNRYRVMSDIRLRIEELFAREGIAISFPQRDVHLDIVNPR
ncbi:mechanosensitive ion channel domain-containing protein [Methylobacter svalbardensis]|uniref:mechanosensitive ion channel domain-containing protein n=1 Tax=Methylobacter svalbardensis TaxID=3080016 RepID=UPI0030EC8F5C